MDMKALRVLRNRILAGCDFRVLPDAPGDPATAEARRAAWTAYRQALRDLPDTVDPEAALTAVAWPTPPAD